MKPKFYFIMAVLLPSLLDGIVTLLGQSSEYWSNYSKINEAAPITFLTYGPWVFLLSILFYTAVLAVIIHKLPKWWSIGAGLFFCMSHSSGFGSWVPYIMVEKMHLPYGYWWFVNIAYLLLMAILIALALRKWLIAEPAERRVKTNLSSTL